ncbi:hypothetical protein IWQ60_012073 [Tieghemiomyces parasiticus]|uniref:Uncharacterized protein n=1 Tax=Tieghemiomyces parasiticus TaxID=78921 RepID=A0A9W7ZII6_9FUNG|nr:hypothetical protein IWQ60_012073 [Tieghemiomyces parasiticus]
MKCVQLIALALTLATVAYAQDIDLNGEKAEPSTSELASEPITSTAEAAAATEAALDGAVVDPNQANSAGTDGNRSNNYGKYIDLNRAEDCSKSDVNCAVSKSGANQVDAGAFMGCRQVYPDKDWDKDLIKQCIYTQLGLDNNGQGTYNGNYYNGQNGQGQYNQGQNYNNPNAKYDSQYNTQQNTQQNSQYNTQQNTQYRPRNSAAGVAANSAMVLAGTVAAFTLGSLLSQ